MYLGELMASVQSWQLTPLNPGQTAAPLLCEGYLEVKS